MVFSFWSFNSQENFDIKLLGYNDNGIVVLRLNLSIFIVTPKFNLFYLIIEWGSLQFYQNYNKVIVTPNPNYKKHLLTHLTFQDLFTCINRTGLLEL